jgi:hypothetical protein
MIRVPNRYGSLTMAQMGFFGAPLKIALNPALRYDPGAKPAWEFDDGADGFL